MPVKDISACFFFVQEKHVYYIPTLALSKSGYGSRRISSTLSLQNGKLPVTGFIIFLYCKKCKYKFKNDVGIKRYFAPNWYPRIAPLLCNFRNSKNIRIRWFSLKIAASSCFCGSQAKKPNRASTNGFWSFWPWYHIYSVILLKKHEYDPVWHAAPFCATFAKSVSLSQSA